MKEVNTDLGDSRLSQADNPAGTEAGSQPSLDGFALGRRLKAGFLDQNQVDAGQEEVPAKVLPGLATTTGVGDETETG